MASCSTQTLSGLKLACESNKGGIKTVYAAYYDEAYKAGITVSAGSITTLSTAQTTWYKYDFKRNTGSMTSTLNVDEAAGTNYVSTDVIMQFNRMETKKRLEMTALSLQELVLLVVDSNDKVWYLGYDEPVVASAGTGQTGVQKSDGNYYQITLTSNDDTYPMEFTGTLPTPANNA